MKYIKKFEFGDKELNTDKNYKVGDYVVIDFEALTKKTDIHDEWPPDEYCLIADESSDEYFDYFAKFINDYGYNIDDDEIERKMTQQEIEEFKIKNDINKYNL